MLFNQFPTEACLAHGVGCIIGMLVKKNVPRWIDALKKYEWSSLREYIGGDDDICDKEMIMSYFSSKELYKDFTLENFTKHVSDFNLNNSLAFFMGHLFRQTHEICLIGVKGKIYNKLKNKSQRSVCLDVSLKHSTKTEILQDRLDLMFPEELKLEMFARRQRQGWTCIGNEVDGPGSNGEDIFTSIERLKNLSV